MLQVLARANYLLKVQSSLPKKTGQNLTNSKCITKSLINLRKKQGKVFKNESSKICGRQPLKNLKGYCLLNHIPSLFFKGCLPQILFSPFLNTLSQMTQILSTLKNLKKRGISVTMTSNLLRKDLKCPSSFMSHCSLKKI